VATECSLLSSIVVACPTSVCYREPAVPAPPQLCSGRYQLLDRAIIGPLANFGWIGRSTAIATRQVLQMNVKVKKLVAGAVITAALGVTATGMAAGAATAAPAAPPAISGPAGHGAPPPQVGRGGPGGPAPQDQQRGPGAPPADSHGPDDHGGQPPGQGGGDFRGQWRGAPWGEGAPPWGWGAPPPPAWRGPLPSAWGPPPPPFDYWGYRVTPVWDPGFNHWGFWLFGVWIPL